MCRAKGCHTPDFAEKTFVNSHKTAKFTKVFFLKSFPLYSTVVVEHEDITLLKYTLLIVKLKQHRAKEIPELKLKIEG